MPIFNITLTGNITISCSTEELTEKLTKILKTKGIDFIIKVIEEKEHNG